MLMLLTAAAGLACSGDAFHAPVRMTAAGSVIKVEAPGFASPCWTDVNRDGVGDLVVGQFNQGKMLVHLGSETGLAAGQWLRAGGQVAEVPGVW